MGRKKIKLQKGQIYKIEWNDTYDHQGWHSEEEIDSKTVNHHFQETVGYYIKKTEDWFIFCTHYNPHENFCAYGMVNWIPRGCIIGIKKLK